MDIGDFSRRVRTRLRDGTAAPIVQRMARERGDAPAPAGSRRDLDYEASPGVAECLDLIRSDAKLILVSGRAGTGKSRLIRYLGSQPEGRRQIVVAPTGIAALNISATTIHKSFQLPFGAIDSRELAPRRLGEEVARIDRLIIDEISMVRADILDAIDARMRAKRADPRPFGGAQVVLVGDFLQLPPVCKPDEEAMLAHLGYDTPYAFSAKVITELDLKVVTLKKVWRQDDADFIEILGRIREGRVTQDDIGWLNDTCARKPRAGSNPMLLCPTKDAAAAYNRAGIAARRDEIRKELGLGSGARGAALGEIVFEGTLKGTFADPRKAEKDMPVPVQQPLLPGVRVMAVKNSGSTAFVNGSLGTVVSVSPGDSECDRPHAMVLFDGKDEPARVERMVWEEIRHRWDREKGEVIKEVVGSYTQVPLVLGYASTIHKSQGLSLEDVRIDLGSGTFAAGQAYVALSRARSTAGLSFVREIRMSDLKTDEMLQDFLAWAQENARLEVVNRDGAAPAAAPAREEAETEIDHEEGFS